MCVYEMTDMERFFFTHGGAFLDVLGKAQVRSLPPFFSLMERDALGQIYMCHLCVRAVCEREGERHFGRERSVFGYAHVLRMSVCVGKRCMCVCSVYMCVECVCAVCARERECGMANFVYFPWYWGLLPVIGQATASLSVCAYL